MAKKGKKYLEAAKLVDRTKAYPIADAIDLAKQVISSLFPIRTGTFPADLHSDASSSLHIIDRR